MTDGKICKIKPLQDGVITTKGIKFVKPCGAHYTDKHNIYCDKYPDECEYYKVEKK